MNNSALATQTLRHAIHPGNRLPQISAEVSALDLSRAQASDVAQEIQDGDWNMRAAAFVNGRFGRNTVGVKCVYVVGPAELASPVSKIGVANNPLYRLSSLQTGNWNRLTIRALLWLVADSSDKASEIERASFLAASEMDARIISEWVAMDAQEASELIVKAARYVGAAVCTSKMMLENFASRVDALHRNEPRIALEAQRDL